MLYPANWLDPLIVAAMAGTWLPDWAMLAGSACLQLLTELSPLPCVCVCVCPISLYLAGKSGPVSFYIRNQEGKSKIYLIVTKKKETQSESILH